MFFKGPSLKKWGVYFDVARDIKNSLGAPSSTLSVFLH